MRICHFKCRLYASALSFIIQCVDLFIISRVALRLCSYCLISIWNLSRHACVNINHVVSYAARRLFSPDIKNVFYHVQRECGAYTWSRDVSLSGPGCAKSIHCSAISLLLHNENGSYELQRKFVHRLWSQSFGTAE